MIGGAPMMTGRDRLLTALEHREPDKVPCDLGATFVVTYTVVAQSLEGVTATPTVAPTKTPFQSFLGATGAPVNAVTPPPTSAARNSSTGGSTPLFALLICLILAGFALAATEFRRRSVRR